MLLALVPMGDEDILKVEGHFDYLMFVLSVCDRSIDNIVTSLGDIERINLAFARCVRLTFVGYHRHCFSLVVRDMLNDYKDLIEKL